MSWKAGTSGSKPLSHDHWLAQGVTLSGQRVACEGSSADVLLACVSKAKATPLDP